MGFRFAARAPLQPIGVIERRGHFSSGARHKSSIVAHNEDGPDGNVIWCCRLIRIGLGFDWDEAKAKINVRKHRISFEDAVTIFDDPISITLEDPEHSGCERRFVTIGYSSRGLTAFE